MTRQRIEFEDLESKRLEISKFNRHLKVVISILVVLVTALSSVYFRNIWNSENTLIEKRLGTFSELRQAAVSKFMKGLEQETQLWSGHESVTAKASEFFQVWDDLPDQDRLALRDFYVEKKREVTDSHAPYSAYQQLHAKHHPTLKAFEAHHGYYDVFFFNRAGDLVYSVEKEADYGLNFSSGGSQYADSGLGEAFRKGMAHSGDGPAVFIDFTPYAPSNDDPAAFLSYPIIMPSGEKIGVYAIQIPIDKFNEVTQYSSGLGETGETYIVGSDFLMRNKSRLSSQDGTLKHKVETNAVRDVIAGKTVSMSGHNYSKNPILIAGRPLEFNKSHWAILTEMETTELRAPLRHYIIFYILSIVFATIFGILSYWILRARIRTQKS